MSCNSIVANVVRLSCNHLCPIKCREMSEMEMRLEYERERREGLEAELDQMRKQLQHTTGELQHCQMMLRQQKVS